MHDGVTLTDAIRQWQTPISGSNTKSARAMSREGNSRKGGGQRSPPGLENQAQDLWVTPKAISGGANSQREERGAGGPDLQEQVSRWPVKTEWMSPTSRDWKGETNEATRHGQQLPDQIVRWSTTHGFMGQERDGSYGGGGAWFGLEDVANGLRDGPLVPPTASSGGTSSRPIQTSPRLRLLRWTETWLKLNSVELSVLWRPDATDPIAGVKPPDSLDGLQAAFSRPRLNPTFVEWLMGVPRNHTIPQGRCPVHGLKR